MIKCHVRQHYSPVTTTPKPTFPTFNSSLPENLTGGGFEDYTAAVHPKDYQFGGIWLETFNSPLGRFSRVVSKKGQTASIDNKFEIITPERVKWLTGINLVIDASVPGEVGVHVANMESVAEMYISEVHENIFNTQVRRQSRSASYEIAFVNGTESERDTLAIFWKNLKEAFQPVYLTAAYGNYIRIEPKANGKTYRIHVYPPPPLEVPTVH